MLLTAMLAQQKGWAQLQLPQPQLARQRVGGALRVARPALAFPRAALAFQQMQLHPAAAANEPPRGGVASWRSTHGGSANKGLA